MFVILNTGSVLERFPIACSHAIDQKSLQIQKLEHILVDWIDSIQSEYALVASFPDNIGLQASLRRRHVLRIQRFFLWGDSARSISGYAVLDPRVILGSCILVSVHPAISRHRGLLCNSIALE
jgi:hypothetical protein